MRKNRSHALWAIFVIVGIVSFNQTAKATEISESGSSVPLQSLKDYPMTETNNSQSNAQQFSFQTIDGEPLNLADQQGKVVMVVNTASQCGFTPQYQDLQQLYEDYHEKGLVIVAVPSNDFGGQEFDTENEVKEFTKKEFSTQFPLSTIENVKGDDAHPFYKWANKKAGFLGSPKWNFHKYIIDKQGNFAGWYSSTTKPTSNKIIQKIEEELAK